MLRRAELLVVGGDEVVDDLGVAGMADGDGQVVIAAESAWFAGADGYVVVLGQAELGADGDFDAAVEGGIAGRRGRRLGTATRCERKCHKDP